MQLSVCANASPSCNLQLNSHRSKLGSSSEASTPPFGSKDSNKFVDLDVPTIHRQTCFLARGQLYQKSRCRPLASSSMIRMAAVENPAAHQMPIEATSKWTPNWVQIPGFKFILSSWRPSSLSKIPRMASALCNLRDILRSKTCYSTHGS